MRYSGTEDSVYDSDGPLIQPQQTSHQLRSSGQEWWFSVYYVIYLPLDMMKTPSKFNIEL